MKNFLTRALIVFIVTSSYYLHAQPYVQSQHVKVFDGNNNLLRNAWDGGSNCPQFALADLNKDGTEDLVIYEASRGSVKTYLGAWVNGEVQYNYAPQFQKNFPAVILGYLKLQDYNCDQIPDLFERGIAGVSVHRGYYDNNELKFTPYKSLYFNNNSINVYVDNGDIPAIVDIDGDGDLDVISFNILGGQLNLFKNQRVEQGLPCDSMVMKWSDACWGRLYQGFLQTQNLHHTCPPPFMAPGFISVDRAKEIRSAAKTTHAGNTLCMVDFDNDGIYNYLNGGISFQQIQYLINGKNSLSGIDSIVQQDTAWDADGHTVSVEVFPAAFWLDVDQNGVKDLIVAPHSDGISDNVKGVNFYKNSGSVSSPVWNYKGDSFFVDQHLDKGSLSQPILYDYNRDGKPDLFIASNGVYQGGGIFKGSLSYYENTSTLGNPSFKLKTHNFLNLQSLNLGSFYIAIGDLDNDGKDDLVLAKADGKLMFYKNSAAINQLPPQWSLQYPVMKTNANADIDVIITGRPFIADVNGDGKNDLLIGRWDGYFSAYSNTGASNALLKFETHRFGEMATLRNGAAIGNSCMYYGPIDNTGQKYFLLGNNYGTLGLFKSTGSSPSFTDTFTNLTHDFAGIHLSGFSYPFVGDVDGDGNKELLLGEYLGGLQLYLQQWNSSANEVVKQEVDWHISPNPSLGKFIVHGLNEPGIIQITDLSGRIILTQKVENKFREILLNVTHVTPGIYLVHFRSQHQISSKKLLISSTH